MNWLDRFRQKPKRLDINQPVPISDIKVPLPDPTKGKATESWKIKSLNPRSRRFLGKERRA